MRRTIKVVALAGAVALSNAWMFGLAGLAGAQDEAKQARSPRGGFLAGTARYQFEVFFYPTGVRVFPRDRAGASLDPAKLAGAATFYHPNSPRAWFERPLRGTADSLDLAVGLGAAPPSGAKVAILVSGLPDPAETAASFTLPLEFVPQTAQQPTEARPTPPAGSAPGPAYVYGPGYYGFGYYRYPGPESAPVAASGPAVYGYSSPGGRGGGGGSGPVHDWSTGRDYPAGGLISKPWLRPMD